MTRVSSLSSLSLSHSASLTFALPFPPPPPSLYLSPYLLHLHTLHAVMSFKGCVLESSAHLVAWEPLTVNSMGHSKWLKSLAYLHLRPNASHKVGSQVVYIIYMHMYMYLMTTNQ